MVQMFGVFAEFERAAILDRSDRRHGTQSRQRRLDQRHATLRLPHQRRLPATRTRRSPAGRHHLRPLHLRRMGAQAIARWLNDHGHRNRAGRRWSHMSVVKLLRNRVYIGQIYFRGTPTTTRLTRRWWTPTPSTRSTAVGRPRRTRLQTRVQQLRLPARRTWLFTPEKPACIEPVTAASPAAAAMQSGGPRRRPAPCANGSGSRDGDAPQPAGAAGTPPRSSVTEVGCLMTVAVGSRHKTDVHAPMRRGGYPCRRRAWRYRFRMCALWYLPADSAKSSATTTSIGTSKYWYTEPLVNSTSSVLDSWS